MLASALHGHLVVGSTQEGIKGPGLDAGRSLLGVTPGETVELQGRPGRSARLDLLREPGRVPGDIEDLIGQDPGHLMMPVTIPGGT
jgi:hypothetical protein